MFIKRFLFSAIHKLPLLYQDLNEESARGSVSQLQIMSIGSSIYVHRLHYSMSQLQIMTIHQQGQHTICKGIRLARHHVGPRALWTRRHL